MTTLTITATDTAGEPLAHREVEVALVAGRTGGHATGGPVVAAPTRIKLDVDGAGSIDLTPNEDIEPAGTFYRVTVLATSPTIVRSLRVPADGPVDWSDEDLLVADPIAPEVGVTRAQLIAALAGTTVHSGLSGRSEPDQHPATAIATVPGVAPGLRADQVVAAWEELAETVEVDPTIMEFGSTFLEAFIVEVGDDVSEQLANAAVLGLLGMALAARTGKGVVDEEAARQAADAELEAAIAERGNGARVVSIVPWEWWSAVSGSAPIRAQGSTQFGAGLLDTTNVSGTWIEWQIQADAGTWALDVYYQAAAFNGAWGLTFDGVSVGGTLNMYQASGTANLVATYPGIVVAANGPHTLRATNTGTGGGGSYAGRWVRLILRRTA